MKKNMFERFRDGELGEMQENVCGFASQGVGDEFYFRAGFYIGRHFEEVSQTDEDESERQECDALREDNARLRNALEDVQAELERLRKAVCGYIKD